MSIDNNKVPVGQVKHGFWTQIGTVFKIIHRSSSKGNNQLGHFIDLMSGIILMLAGFSTIVRVDFDFFDVAWSLGQIGIGVYFFLRITRPKTSEAKQTNGTYRNTIERERG